MFSDLPQPNHPESAGDAAPVSDQTGVRQEAADAVAAHVAERDRDDVPFPPRPIKIRSVVISMDDHAEDAESWATADSPSENFLG